MRRLLLLPFALAGLAACTPDGYDPNGVPLIARAQDTFAGNRDTLQNRPMAIAVTPDGCQQWLGDNGVEGYADTRWDPRSGLPVCSSSLPPGAVIGEYRQTGLIDILP